MSRYTACTRVGFKKNVICLHLIFKFAANLCCLEEPYIQTMLAFAEPKALNNRTDNFKRTRREGCMA
jgi:hypothetical protein